MGTRGWEDPRAHAVSSMLLHAVYPYAQLVMLFNVGMYNKLIHASTRAQPNPLMCLGIYVHTWRLADGPKGQGHLGNYLLSLLHLSHLLLGK